MTAQPRPRFTVFVTGLYRAISDKCGNGHQGAPPAQGKNRNGMHIYIWAGLKSHGEDQHDYPRFLADWSKILTERGAVDGALRAPSGADLKRTGVVVIYKGSAIAKRARSWAAQKSRCAWKIWRKSRAWACPLCASISAR
jgi:hypothetical protein